MSSFGIDQLIKLPAFDLPVANLGPSPLDVPSVSSFKDHLQRADTRQPPNPDTASAERHEAEEPTAPVSESAATNESDSYGSERSGGDGPVDDTESDASVRDDAASDAQPHSDNESEGEAAGEEAAVDGQVVVGNQQLQSELALDLNVDGENEANVAPSGAANGEDSQADDSDPTHGIDIEEFDVTGTESNEDGNEPDGQLSAEKRGPTAIANPESVHGSESPSDEDAFGPKPVEGEQSSGHRGSRAVGSVKQTDASLNDENVTLLDPTVQIEEIPGGGSNRSRGGRSSRKTTPEVGAAQAVGDGDANASGRTPVTGASSPSVSRLMSGRLTGRALANQDANLQVDNVRFVQRVMRAIQVGRDRGGEVQLRLHPPELGSMRIDVSVKNGVLSARLEAETPAARTVLLDNLPVLRDRLAQQEIKIGQFDIGLMDPSRGGLPDQTGDAPDDRQGRTGRSPVHEPEADDRGVQPVTGTRGDEQLNVIV